MSRPKRDTTRRSFNYNENSDDYKKKKSKKNDKKVINSENLESDEIRFIEGKLKPGLRRKWINRFIANYEKNLVKDCNYKSMNLYYRLRDNEQRKTLLRKWRKFKKVKSLKEKKK
jgi:hypothetical protein